MMCETAALTQVQWKHEQPVVFITGRRARRRRACQRLVTRPAAWTGRRRSLILSQTSATTQLHPREPYTPQVPRSWRITRVCWSLLLALWSSGGRRQSSFQLWSWPPGVFCVHLASSAQSERDFSSVGCPGDGNAFAFVSWESWGLRAGALWHTLRSRV